MPFIVMLLIHFSYLCTACETIQCMCTQYRCVIFKVTWYKNSKRNNSTTRSVSCPCSYNGRCRAQYLSWLQRRSSIGEIVEQVTVYSRGRCSLQAAFLELNHFPTACCGMFRTSINLSSDRTRYNYVSLSIYVT